MKTKFLSIFAMSIFAIFGISISASAQTSPSTQNFPNIKIKNFGQMDENYFRGAQPNPEDYASLAAIGINTIIDLRNDPTDYERSAAEAVGIKYVNIPMSGWRSPKDEDIAKFLSIANAAETGKFYVHCKAGIHRTGVTGAIYRFEKYGWDYDQAYKEMKNYDFSTGLVHGALKSYVKDYSRKIASKPKASPAIQVAASQASN